jgi:hypothetical protein
MRAGRCCGARVRRCNVHGPPGDCLRVPRPPGRAGTGPHDGRILTMPRCRWTAACRAWPRCVGAAAALALVTLGAPAQQVAEPWRFEPPVDAEGRLSARWRVVGLPQQKPPLTATRRVAWTAGRAATGGAGVVRQLRARRRGPAGAAAPVVALAAGPAQPGGRPAHQARRRHRRARLPGLRAAAGAGAFRRTPAAALARGELGRDAARGHAVLGVGHGRAARCRDRQPLQPARALHRVAHAGRRQRAAGWKNRATWRPTGAAPSATRPPSRRRWRR